MDVDLLDLSDSDVERLYSNSTFSSNPPPAAVTKNDALSGSARSTETAAPSAPAQSTGKGQPIGLIGVNCGPQISEYEGKLRILDCCEELGLSSTHPVFYADVQELYKEKHKATLNKEELKRLFNSQKAKAVINEIFKGELVCEAESDASGAPQVIKYVSDKDIRVIISILEEKTAIDKISREEEAAEILGIESAEPTPKTFKIPDKLLPKDFTIKDSRFANPKKNVLGFKKKNQSSVDNNGKSFVLREILNVISGSVPVIQQDANADNDDNDALLNAQLAAAEKRAQELARARMMEDANGSDAVPDGLNSDENEKPANFMDTFFPGSSVPALNAKQNFVTAVKSNGREASAVTEKPEDLQNVIFTDSIAQPVDETVFRQLGKTQDSSKPPVPPPRKTAPSKKPPVPPRRTIPPNPALTEVTPVTYTFPDSSDTTESTSATASSVTLYYARPKPYKIAGPALPFHLQRRDNLTVKPQMDWDLDFIRSADLKKKSRFAEMATGTSNMPAPTIIDYDSVDSAATGSDSGVTSNLTTPTVPQERIKIPEELATLPENPKTVPEKLTTIPEKPATDGSQTTSAASVGVDSSDTVDPEPVNDAVIGSGLVDLSHSETSTMSKKLVTTPEKRAPTSMEPATIDVSTSSAPSIGSNSSATANFESVNDAVVGSGSVDPSNLVTPEKPAMIFEQRASTPAEPATSDVQTTSTASLGIGSSPDYQVKSSPTFKYKFANRAKTGSVSVDAFKLAAAATPEKPTTTHVKTTPPASIGFNASAPVNLVPTLMKAVTTESPKITAPQVDPCLQRSVSSISSIDAVGTPVVHNPPEVKYTESYIAKKLKASSKAITKLVEDATNDVDRFIDESLKSEKAELAILEEKIAAIKKKNNAVIAEYSKKVKAELDEKLNAELAEQKKYMKLFEAMKALKN